MSFMREKREGRTFTAGWYLAREECTRETISLSPAQIYRLRTTGCVETLPSGKVLILDGTPIIMDAEIVSRYPGGSNGLILGFLYGPVEVDSDLLQDDDQPAERAVGPVSIVTHGTIYWDRLPGGVGGESSETSDTMFTVADPEDVWKPERFVFLKAPEMTLPEYPDE